MHGRASPRPVRALGPILNDQRATERVFRAKPHLVEVAHDDSVGAQQAGLRIADPVAFAEVATMGCARRRLGRGAGKQVMLDLVVEASEREVRWPAAADVAGHQHLTPEKVDLLVVRDDGHASVVRGERTSQEQAEQSHLDAKEGGRLTRWQDHQQDGDVSTETNNNECGFGPPVFPTTMPEPS